MAACQIHRTRESRVDGAYYREMGKVSLCFPENQNVPLEEPRLIVIMFRIQTGFPERQMSRYKAHSLCNPSFVISLPQKERGFDLGEECHKSLASG